MVSSRPSVHCFLIPLANQHFSASEKLKMKLLRGLKGTTTHSCWSTARQHGALYFLLTMLFKLPFPFSGICCECTSHKHKDKARLIAVDQIERMFHPLSAIRCQWTAESINCSTLQMLYKGRTSISIIRAVLLLNRFSSATTRFN